MHPPSPQSSPENKICLSKEFGTKSICRASLNETLLSSPSESVQRCETQATPAFTVHSDRHQARSTRAGASRSTSRYVPCPNPRYKTSIFPRFCHISCSWPVIGWNDVYGGKTFEPCSCVHAGPPQRPRPCRQRPGKEVSRGGFLCDRRPAPQSHLSGEASLSPRRILPPRPLPFHIAASSVSLSQDAWDIASPSHSAPQAQREQYIYLHIPIRE